MEISFDLAKRPRTLAERGLDFADAPRVFAGCTVEVEDTRREYGEERILCYGLLAGRLVVARIWTPTFLDPRPGRPSLQPQGTE
jgi:uncharacterized protein